MRVLLFPLIVLTAACRNDAADNSGQAPAGQRPAVAAESLWSGGARDRLCTRDERAGLVVYAAAGDANCSIRGTLTRKADLFQIRPDGDQACVVEARAQGAAVTFGPLSPACAYYCGPKASYAGKRMEQKPNHTPAVDLAGDPLC